VVSACERGLLLLTGKRLFLTICTENDWNDVDTSDAAADAAAEVPTSA
jgi:hypothetical protein